MPMEYEDLIEEDADPIEPKPLDEAEAEFVEKKPKSPWKAFILTGLLASLIGAVGGGYGVYEGTKRITPHAADLPKTDLAPLETKLEKLTSRLSAAEASVTEVANRPLPEIESPELAEIDLSEFESRLEALESAPSPEIDPAALTALQTAQDDGFEWPDTSELETRLAALESQLETSEDVSVPTDISDRLDALETKIEAAQISEDGSENPDVAFDGAAFDEERLESFEARLEALEKRPEPAARVKRVSILAFPKDAMTAAVEDNQTGSFMKKALSKHVRVKDDDAPLTLIDAIEADIAEGRLDDAAIKYDRLPDPVRAAGKAWYESVKASL